MVFYGLVWFFYDVVEVPFFFFFFFQAGAGIRVLVESRGLEDVYKGQRRDSGWLV